MKTNLAYILLASGVLAAGISGCATQPESKNKIISSQNFQQQEAEKL